MSRIAVTKITNFLRRGPRVRRLLDPRAFACGILGLAFVVAVIGLVDPGSTSARTILPSLVDEAQTALAKPPVLPAMLYKKLSAEQAVAFNQRLPFTPEPNAPARPFQLGAHSTDYARSLECLTAAAYYEASGEGPAGEAAVAQVVLNRVRNPAFPASVCAVVYQGSTRTTGCQFTFTCDGSLLRAPDSSGWKAARAVAAAALTGTVFAEAGLATHYHADTVVPYWASSLAKNAQVGAHIFYRWPGAWGRPAAFRQHYSGEPWQQTQLRNAALIAHHIAPPVDDGSPIAVAVNEVSPKPDPLAVVKLLAAGNASDGEAKLVRASFKDELPAVQAYRQFATAHGDANDAAIAASLSRTGNAKDPAVDQLAAWINDFASSPSYAAFAKSAARPTRSRAELANALLPALRDIQAYSGISIGKVLVTVIPAGADAGALCAAAPSAGSSRQPRRSHAASSAPTDATGARLGQAAADYLQWRARTQSGDGAVATGGCSSAVDQQVVAAMLIRMAALKNDDASADKSLAWEAGHGHALVPVLIQRLRLFEANRDKYVTLAQAFDALIDGLSAPAAPRPSIPIAKSSAVTGPQAGAGLAGVSATGS